MGYRVISRFAQREPLTPATWATITQIFVGRGTIPVVHSRIKRVIEETD